MGYRRGSQRSGQFPADPAHHPDVVTCASRRAGSRRQMPGRARATPAPGSPVRSATVRSEGASREHGPRAGRPWVAWRWGRCWESPPQAASRTPFTPRPQQAQRLSLRIHGGGRRPSALGSRWRGQNGVAVQPSATRAAASALMFASSVSVVIGEVVAVPSPAGCGRAHQEGRHLVARHRGARAVAGSRRNHR